MGKLIDLVDKCQTQWVNLRRSGKVQSVMGERKDLQDGCKNLVYGIEDLVCDCKDLFGERKKAGGSGSTVPVNSSLAKEYFVAKTGTYT